MRIRTAESPRDWDAIALLDASFTTSVIYDVVADANGFRLDEVAVPAPLRKTYPAPEPESSDHEYLIAELVPGEIVGYTGLRFQSWNGAATITDLAVDPAHRGNGVGRALIDGAAERARTGGARSLWLETQNVNHPAIQFYRRCGFRLCGVDTAAYDPAEHAGEVALYFTRDV